jgi:hypothetical protein
MLRAAEAELAAPPAPREARRPSPARPADPLQGESHAFLETLEIDGAGGGHSCDDGGERSHLDLQFPTIFIMAFEIRDLDLFCFHCLLLGRCLRDRLRLKRPRRWPPLSSFIRFAVSAFAHFLEDFPSPKRSFT